MGGFTGGRQLKPEPSGRDQQQKLASILNERCRNSDTGQPSPVLTYSGCNRPIAVTIGSMHTAALPEEMPRRIGAQVSRRSPYQA